MENLVLTFLRLKPSEVYTKTQYKIEFFANNGKLSLGHAYLFYNKNNKKL